MGEKGDSVRVVITSPLDDSLIQAIAATDPRLDVVYERDLVPVPRYPADHTLPSIASPRARARWERLLEEADVLFDFGPRDLTERLPSWPRLRWIQATSAGVGQFAVRTGLTRSPIVVTTASGVHARPLAEFVLMAMLMFEKGAFRLFADQRERRWERYAGGEIAGKTVGVVGAGRIGREVARVARALDARAVGVVRALDGRGAADLGMDALFPVERIDDVLPAVDYLVLCLPHTADTYQLLSAARLALLKPEAVLINVARGAVVDEEALTAMLQSGRLRGAARDVFAREPMPPESPLWGLPNVLISPHSASTASGENQKIVDLFRENLRRYLDGQPLRNVLDKCLLY